MPLFYGYNSSSPAIDGIDVKLLSTGLIASNIEDLLRTYVANARAVSQFDKLPIPYRAVATDDYDQVTCSDVIRDADIAFHLFFRCAYGDIFAMKR